MNTWRVASVALMAGAVLVGGCGGSEEEAVCLEAGSAKVCLQSDDGSVAVEASGLEAGSELELETDDSGASTYEVGPDGSPSGRIGILQARSDQPVEVRISATAGDGSPIDGELRLGD